MTGLAVAFSLGAAALGVVTLVLARRSAAQLAALQRSRRELRDAMVRIGAATKGDDHEGLFDVVLRVAVRVAAADEAVLWAMAGTGLLARAATDPGRTGARLVRGEGLAGWVAEQGEAARWPPSMRAPAPAEPLGAAALAVPVFSQDRLFGVLEVVRHRAGAFPVTSVEDMAAVAGQTGSAIEMMQLHDETRRLSLTDGLTGLWNRRQFDLRLAQELERAGRFGERFSVVIVDLDEFKHVNDTHGHPAGDAVLVEVARRLVACTREVDLVARFGGEEFALLLPQTDLPGALKVAEKVRAEVSDQPIDTDAGALSVSLSAGVASHPQHGTLAADLLRSADEALYRAKAAGKNQVVTARGVPTA